MVEVIKEVEKEKELIDILEESDAEQEYGWCYLPHRGTAYYLLYVAQEPANYLLYAVLSAGRYPLL